MKKVFYVFFFALCGMLTGYSQVTSGILIGGGAGTLNTKFENNIPSTRIGTIFDGTYNYDLHLGYRFRIQQTERFFWDLDALVGMKCLKKSILTATQTNSVHPGYVAYNDLYRDYNYYIGVLPTFNVKMYKGLHAGVGIQPTFVFYRSKSDNCDFALPAVVKLGYDFGPLSLEASGKFGLLRDGVKDVISRNRAKEFQLSIYVPLFK